MTNTKITLELENGKHEAIIYNESESELRIKTLDTGFRYRYNKETEEVSTLSGTIIYGKVEY